MGRVETLSAGRVENYTNRLYEKLKVILEDRNIDDARVLTEAAIFGDKTAVDEETVPPAQPHRPSTAPFWSWTSRWAASWTF